MADVLWKVFEAAVNFFESFVIIHFLCVFLNTNLKNSKGQICFIIGVALDFLCVTIINKFSAFEGIGGLIYMLIYALYCLIFLKGSVLKKLFAAAISTVVLLIVGICSSNVITALFQSDMDLLYEQRSIERICAIVLVEVLLVCIYDIILKYKVVGLKRREWNLILSIMIISFLTMVCIHISRIDGDIKGVYLKLITAAEFGIIILNIVCFYMTYTLSKSNAEAEELKMKHQQEEYRLSYAENIKNQYEEIRRMRHDMKQNLAVLSELYREQKYDEARNFADKVTKNLAKFDNVIDVQNAFINAILNSKLSTALEYGIKVICSSSNNVSGIDDIDLCNLLGNMLDNAIEAAKMCEMGYIEVSINSDENKILVIIANSIVTSVLNSNKELISTKADSARHGYGIKTIRSIANKYNGTAKFYEEGNLFYCQVLMYKSVNAKLT